MKSAGKKLFGIVVCAMLAFAFLSVAGCTWGNKPSQQPASSSAVTSTQTTSQPQTTSTTSSSKPTSSSTTSSSGKSTSSGKATSSSSTSKPSSTASSSSKSTVKVKENGTYTSKEEVALYIHTYGKLPSNFITKTKAKKAGWVATEGNLDKVCPGKSIGGSIFYNDEGKLPDAKGRTWKECDINYHGGFRGKERIVFSSDGLIFYSGDHYETFEQLY